MYTNPVYRVTVPDDMPASNIPGMTECTADSFLEPGLRKVWIFTGPENSVLTFQVGVHSREEEISDNDYLLFLKHSGKIGFYSVCLHVKSANSSKFNIVSMVTGSLTGM